MAAAAQLPPTTFSSASLHFDSVQVLGHCLTFVAKIPDDTVKLSRVILISFPRTKLCSAHVAWMHAVHSRFFFLSPFIFVNRKFLKAHDSRTCNHQNILFSLPRRLLRIHVQGYDQRCLQKFPDVGIVLDFCMHTRKSGC